MTTSESVKNFRELLYNQFRTQADFVKLTSDFEVVALELEQAYEALNNADATVKNLMQDLGIQCLPCQLPRFAKEKFLSLLTEIEFWKGAAQSNAKGMDSLRADLENVRQESRQYKEAMIRAEALYMELLLQVGNVYPGETRHQTALRYLRQAEAPNSSQSCSKSPTPAAPGS